jgi:hypothetical protein
MSFEESLLKIRDEKEKETTRLLEEEKGKEMKQQWETLITHEII